MKLNELNKVTNSFNNAEKMPVLFLGHGSPMNAIEENEFVNGWREAGKSIPRPNAIICISAHWETRGSFEGFQRHYLTFSIRHPEVLSWQRKQKKLLRKPKLVSMKNGD